MKKSSFTGWRDVYSFTLIQTLKNKAFIISFIILLTLSIVSMPLISMITSSGKEDTNTPSPIQKVYVSNRTELPNMDFSEILKNETISHISFEVMGEDYDVVSKRIEEKENDSIILTITEKEGMFALDFVKASKGSIKDSNMQSLSNAISEQFTNLRINTLGITEEQIAMINAKVESEVSLVDTNGAQIVKEDTSITFSEYWFIYGLLFIVMMVNVMASTQVATSIVTEKSTRVIEYLLISVKPLALMIGKITAMLTAVLLQMISMVVVLFVSNKVSTSLSSGNGENILTKYISKDIFQNLTFIHIVFCFILIILGMIFYATLAGLAGATVSRIEEMKDGLMLFTFTNIIGAYIGLGAISVLMGKGINSFVTFAYLFPISSPFILPGAILVGKASLPIIFAALVLQLIFIALLFKFVAKVFEALILHTGNKIKVNELFKLSKTSRKETKNER